MKEKDTVFGTHAIIEEIKDEYKETVALWKHPDDYKIIEILYNLFQDTDTKQKLEGGLMEILNFKQTIF